MNEKPTKRRNIKRWQMSRLRRLSYIPSTKRTAIQQERVEQLERAVFP